MSHRLGGLADFKFAAQINSTFTALVAGQDRDDLCLRESGFLHDSKVRSFSYFRVHRLQGSLQKWVFASMAMHLFQETYIKIM